MTIEDRLNQMLNIYRSSISDGTPPGLEELSEPIAKAILRSVAISQSNLEKQIKQEFLASQEKDKGKRNQK